MEAVAVVQVVTDCSMLGAGDDRWDDVANGSRLFLVMAAVAATELVS